jgi:hypothetical protein
MSLKVIAEVPNVEHAEFEAAAHLCGYTLPRTVSPCLADQRLALVLDGSNFPFEKPTNLCCQLGRKGEGGWRASCGRGRPQQGAALLANPGRSLAQPFSGPRVLFSGPWQVPGALGCESHRMDDQPAENPPAGGTEPKKLKDTSRSKSKRSFTQSAPNEVCMPVPTPPDPPLAHLMQLEQSLDTVVAVGRYGGLEWTLEVVGTGELGSGQRILATGDESRCAG